MLRVLFLVFVSVMFADTVSKPVINIYMQPEEGRGIDSQAIYGENLQIVETGKNGWLKVKAEDNVTGWIKDSQVIKNQDFEKSSSLRSVKNLFAHVYSVAATDVYIPLLTLPYGSRVKLINPQDLSEKWLAIELVDGRKAYIQKEDIYFVPQKPKTLKEILVFSRNFLGLPYTWGGRSSFGFDCSGFVQMLVKEMGIVLPRNSQDQAQSPLVQEVALDQIKPGDLLFFGEAKIVHVGMYLGDNQFIDSGTSIKPVIMIRNVNSCKHPLKTARRLQALSQVHR